MSEKERIEKDIKSLEGRLANLIHHGGGYPTTNQLDQITAYEGSIQDLREELIDIENKEILCPLWLDQSFRCRRENCGWWDANRHCCAVLSIALNTKYLGGLK